MNMDNKIKTVSFGGLNINFVETEGKIFFLSAVAGNRRQDFEDIQRASIPLVDMQMTETGSANLNFSPALGLSPGHNMFLESFQETENYGTKNVLVAISEASGLCRAEVEYQMFDDCPIARCRTRLYNTSSRQLTLEKLSSVVVHNLARINIPLEQQEVYVYTARSNWACEGQWNKYSLAQFGITQTYKYMNQAYTSANISNVGSFSSKSFLPMAVLENKTSGLTYFWQIEYSGSWQWELADNGNGVYLWAGGPDINIGNWRHELLTGDFFETIPVAFGVVEGGFTDAIKALTDYRRNHLKPANKANACLPVIFNDYMNGLRANPTEENEIPFINAASKTGAEYYVIDAGWYSKIGQSWWTLVGPWEVNKERFGKTGLDGLCQLIREKGMKPGIWVEIEAVGVHSKTAEKPDDWFFLRNGKRISDNGRYFLDFRNPQVRKHTRAVIDGLIDTYRFEYIKIDYNINSGPGTDLNASSPASGQIEHVRAYYGWLADIRKQYPYLLIENCSSGGLRMDYGMLSLTDLQSLSDQNEARFFTAIICGCMANVLPEQAMAWAYPLASDNLDMVAFNLVNVMTSRVLLSGQIDKLNDSQMALVQKGIDVYKRIRPFITQSYPFWPQGFVHNYQQNGWASFGLRDENRERILLCVWKFKSDSDKQTINLSEYISSDLNAAMIYPDFESHKYNWEKSQKVLELDFKGCYTAAVFEFYK